MSRIRFIFICPRQSLGAAEASVPSHVSYEKPQSDSTLSMRREMLDPKKLLRREEYFNSTSIMWKDSSYGLTCIVNEIMLARLLKCSLSDVLFRNGRKTFGAI